MTREEAQAECAKLAKEHPDRETHRFVPRKTEDGTWAVAKVGLPPVAAKPLGREARINQKPPDVGGRSSGI
jgi:hypothetical protein